MIAPIDKVRGEGNCARATVGGKEAGTRAARLRTETFYKAGSVRRVSTTSRSRSQTTVQVKDELVQPQITFSSGRPAYLVLGLAATHWSGPLSLKTNLLLFVEPPSADPHARWGGEGGQQ